MSYLLYGKKGSGKSYYAVKNFVLPHLSSGKNVFTNLDLGYHRQESGLDLSWIPPYKYSDYLQKDVRGLLHTFRQQDELLDKIKLDFQNDIEGKSLRIPYHSMVIIDEAHDIFDYLSVNRMDKRVYNFLSYARHFDIELVFITQAPMLLSKFVQGLCNYVIKVKNLAEFGMGRKSIKIFHYQYVHSIEPDNTEIQVYDSSIFSLYRSSLCKENQVKTKLPLWIFPIIFVFLLWGLYILNSSSKVLLK